MIVSNFGSQAFAAESTLSDEELASLALPIVQSYETEANASVWTMDESTRLVIPATEEYMDNERLQEVIELIAAEFLEKEIPTKSEMKKVYADEVEVTSQDIVIR